MKVNMSNLIEDIYLNLFALGQNIELQIMTIWVHLSTYLIFVLNLSPFKLFNAGSKVSKNGFHQTYRSEDTRQRNTFFSFKRRMKEKIMISKYDVVSTSV